MFTPIALAIGGVHVPSLPAGMSRDHRDWAKFSFTKSSCKLSDSCVSLVPLRVRAGTSVLGPMTSRKWASHLRNVPSNHAGNGGTTVLGPIILAGNGQAIGYEHVPSTHAGKSWDHRAFIPDPCGKWASYLLKHVPSSHAGKSGIARFLDP